MQRQSVIDSISRARATVSFHGQELLYCSVDNVPPVVRKECCKTLNDLILIAASPTRQEGFSCTPEYLNVTIHQLAESCKYLLVTTHCNLAESLKSCLFMTNRICILNMIYQRCHHVRVPFLSNILQGEHCSAPCFPRVVAQHAHHCFNGSGVGFANGTKSIHPSLPRCTPLTCEELCNRFDCLCIPSLCDLLKSVNGHLSHIPIFMLQPSDDSMSCKAVTLSRHDVQST
mmetsp:Transcript_66015/g.157846  ORF Transcript_66015/g.157846 Transcript_66015/m.157846 type:complete len:230 (-) Transcript_66015:782-1471(-)